jgi:transcriptional regulator with XRE-family HTH domain
MGNSLEPKTRVRGLVGRNVDELLTAKGLRQQDFAELLRRSGLADWPQETISRFVKGGRSLSLEDAIIIAAGLQVRLDRLLAGDGTALLGGQSVPTAQLRDVIATGRVQQDNVDSSPLDLLSEGAPGDGTALERQIAEGLGIPVRKVQTSARHVWPDFALDQELSVRMSQSLKRWRDAETLGVAASPDDRIRRAWRGHHVRAMIAELGDYLGIEL